MTERCLHQPFKKNPMTHCTQLSHKEKLSQRNIPYMISSHALSWFVMLLIKQICYVMLRLNNFGIHAPTGKPVGPL